MIDTAVPMALSGEMVGRGLTAPAELERAAADDAMGPGRADEVATAGLLIFLADSCRRVFTTESSVWIHFLGKDLLTPNRIRTRSGHDTRNDSRTQVNDRTIQRRLPFLLRWCIWELFRQVHLGRGVEIKVDGPIEISTVLSM
jgi:hypothetical protein